MKRNNQLISIFVLTLCSFLFFCGVRAEEPDQELPFPDPQVTISMDLKDASIKDILKVFSIQSGLNFIASEAVQDRLITLYLDNSPVKEAMEKLFKANNLSYDLEPSSNIIIVKDWGKPEIETVTKVFYLKYATVSVSSMSGEIVNSFKNGKSISSLVDTVKKLLTKDGSVVEDPRTNSLIVTDVPSRMPVLAQTIASLDIPVPQVMLEVEMLDVNKNVVDKLGFEFSESPLTLILPGSFTRRGFVGYFGPLATKGAEGAVSLGGHYAQALDFLRTHTDTKYLARPRILTLNNETAEIAITKDEVVGRKETTESTSSGTTTNIEYIRSTDLKLTPEGVGVYLRVTPQVNLDSNEITMVILPKSSITNTSTLATTQADAEIRSSKSVVKVRDGETVILGGLIHEDKQITTKKLPILSDIPVFGLLFRHKNQTKFLERELLVFITPRIVKDKYRKAGFAKNMVLPEREQRRNAAFERQAAINSSLNRFEVQ